MGAQLHGTAWKELVWVLCSAEGATAVVYAAIDKQSGRQVALKVGCRSLGSTHSSCLAAGSSDLALIKQLGPASHSCD